MNVAVSLLLSLGLLSPPESPTAEGILDLALPIYAEEDPALDVQRTMRRLDRLTRGARARLEGAATPRARVQALNRYFFLERGFTADLDLDDPDNLFPDRVLDRRRGYCTGLASLYASVAARLGLPVYGVNTPHHLFLRYDDGEVRINIETLEDGREISDETYRMRYRIPPTSEEQGIYLTNLSNDRFLSQLVNNLGALRSLAGELDRGAELYRRALALDPVNPTALFNRARLQMREKRFAEALEGFSRVLELNPQDVPSLNNRGVCSLKLGNPDAAASDFLEALSIDPSSAEARKNLDLMTRGGGN
jgi:regulator of sirC expression with transglutaminase-like and TPR domain